MDDREKLIELLLSVPSAEYIYGKREGKRYTTAWHIANHLIANGVTIGGSDLIAEVITDRIICDQEGKYHHQFRFKLGDRDLGISKELPEELVALAMMEQQWIPVTERLPECDQVVLCYKADRGVRIGKHLSATYADGVVAFRDLVRDYAFGATHWMPLPEPPKEGAEDG